MSPILGAVIRASTGKALGLLVELMLFDFLLELLDSYYEGKRERLSEIRKWQRKRSYYRRT